ncbi:MAG: WxL domain-containing protein [Enterococcaceae bacterium]|jgi:tyrosine-protein phosphatase YwqE|nr:WxL domain-containing protein [Enterococcaceae bacterium]MCI1920136.1 WxL domain-containing protein [Enterococcaceae bacterium]
MDQRRKIHKIFCFMIGTLVLGSFLFFVSKADAAELGNDFMAEEFFFNAKERAHGWQMGEAQKWRLRAFKDIKMNEEVSVQLDSDVYEWAYSNKKVNGILERFRFQGCFCSIESVEASEGFDVSFVGTGTGDIKTNNWIKLKARKPGHKGTLKIRYSINMREIWRYTNASSDDGYTRAVEASSGRNTFNIFKIASGGSYIGYLTETYDISSKPVGNIITKKAEYRLGEQYDTEARSRLLDYAEDENSKRVSYESDRIIPVIPRGINQALRKERIDALFDENMTLTLRSAGGDVSSSSRAVANYGNAIVLRGLESPERDGGGAFALVDNDTDGVLKVVATSGKRNDNDKIHPRFSSDFFCGIAHWPMGPKTIMNLTNASVQDQLWVQGKTEKQVFLDAWGTNRVKEVSYGDLIQVGNADGKIGYTTDSKYTSLKQFDNPEKGPHDVFFEITKHGYVPLVINQLKPLKITVPYNATQEELEKRLPDTLDKRGRSNITVKRFSKTPATDKIGPAEAKVVAVETLESGKEVEFEYTIPVEVMTPGTIEAVDAQYVLGEAWNTETRSRLLRFAQEADKRNVPYKSDKIVPSIPNTIERMINKNRIDAFFADNITLTFNSETGTVKATSKASVNYGDAVVLRGDEGAKNQDAGGAFALLKEGSELKVIATSGKSLSDEPVASSYHGDFFTGIAYLDMTQSKNKDLSAVAVKDFCWAKGETQKQKFLDQWGKSRVQTVKSGDVLKVENAAGKIGYTKNSAYDDLGQLKNTKEVYFEITEKGYVPLTINQLALAKVTISQDASAEELAESLPKFLKKADQKEFKVERYAKTPETAQTGTQTAQIIVSQMLKSGKKAEYTYPVEVTVVKRGELKTQAGSYVLGEAWGVNSPKRMFKSAQEIDGTSIRWIDDKIKSITPDAINKKLNQKNQRIDQLFSGIDIPIGFESATGYVTSASKAQAGYGNAVIIRGLEMKKGRDAAGAFALLHENGLPKIVATSGYSADNMKIHTYFPDKVFAEAALFKRNSETSLNLTSTKADVKITATGATLKQDFLDQWGVDRAADAEYGDIFFAKDHEDKIKYAKDSVLESLSGENKKERFFEITKSGYVPLLVNQVDFAPLTIEHDAEKSVIEQKITSQLKSQQPQIELEKIIVPDLDQVGDVNIKVLVSEKSNADQKNKILYQYLVKMTIEEGNLSFERTPSAADFGTVEITDRLQKAFRKNNTENQTLGIRDTRSKKSTWYLYAKESKPFTNSKNEKLQPNILFYRQNKQELELSGQQQRIYSSQEKKVHHELTFGKLEGLFLKIPGNLNLATDDYRCEIQWTLTDAPL